MRKRPEQMDAYDLVLQALYRLYRLGEKDADASHELLQRAIAADPAYSSAYALLAKWHLMQVGQGQSTNAKADADEAADGIGI